MHTRLRERPSTLTLPGPRSPRNPVPRELQRGRGRCVTLADHHRQATRRRWPSPSSLQPRSRSGDVNPKVNLTFTLNYVVSHFRTPLQNAVVVTVKKFSFLALPSAGTPASPCPSNELPPLLQTTCKNQGKQELMLQLILRLFSLWLYRSLCRRLINCHKYRGPQAALWKVEALSCSPLTAVRRRAPHFARSPFIQFFFFPKQTCC